MGRNYRRNNYWRHAWVYTDGACELNGQKGARAGIGVYWGPNHPLNVSEALVVRQTNNRAELQAAVVAIKQAMYEGFQEITIFTDSRYVVWGMTRWIHRWIQNGWNTFYRKPVKNQADFQQLLDAENTIVVNWELVRGHARIEGNVAADRLAKRGIRRSYYFFLEF
uniref:ribonuclease H n=1 Tax=Strigamia maritima TaxID=126957 RepID=T1IVV0_STRMM